MIELRSSINHRKAWGRQGLLGKAQDDIERHVQSKNCLVHTLNLTGTGKGHLARNAGTGRARF